MKRQLRVVLTGSFVNDRRCIKARLISENCEVTGSVDDKVNVIVVGSSTSDKSVAFNAKVNKAKSLGVTVMTEFEFIKICGWFSRYNSEFKMTLTPVKRTPYVSPFPAPVQPNDTSLMTQTLDRSTRAKQWNVGDECWISNDKGCHIDDDAFCMIGDDLTMRIAALYDNKAGQAMAVVEHVNGGPSRCFVIDMLREHKSLRDKAIDNGMAVCEANEKEHPNFKFLLGKLYDAKLLIVPGAPS